MCVYMCFVSLTSKSIIFFSDLHKPFCASITSASTFFPPWQCLQLCFSYSFFRNSLSPWNPFLKISLCYWGILFIIALSLLMWKRVIFTCQILTNVSFSAWSWTNLTSSQPYPAWYFPKVVVLAEHYGKVPG